MSKTKEEAEHMRKFADQIRDSYHMAEGLRDCTEDYTEKDRIASKWEKEAGL